MDHMNISNVSTEPAQITSPLLSKAKHENWQGRGEANVRKLRYLKWKVTFSLTETYRNRNTKKWKWRLKIKCGLPDTKWQKLSLRLLFCLPQLSFTEKYLRKFALYRSLHNYCHVAKHFLTFDSWLIQSWSPRYKTLEYVSKI